MITVADTRARGDGFMQISMSSELKLIVAVAAALGCGIIKIAAVARVVIQ